MEQPAGTVTFLFTDIEGSTRLLGELGAERYREALSEHRRVMREAFARYGGYEVDYEGDAFFVAFQDAATGMAAAQAAQAALAGGPVRVRMGLHTGTPILDPPKYVGMDVHLAARVMSAGHGGQILATGATWELGGPPAGQELGEHRLKDFSEPVQLFQLGDGSFPPLKTISNTNLPRPASSFVGREREVAEVASVIRGGARLVTLTGPGGTGKTRLAIEAASELVGEFKAGVFWVGLAPVREPAVVLETVAQTIGARGELAADIGERELLLLLDNLEQVVEAAPGLATLLEACPNLVLLATSRELLRVRGEVEYQVLPLAEPEAVQLFCARGGVEASPAVGELCSRLDDMPLALELAAARAKLLTVEQILDRLSQRLDLFTGGRDADPRQRTLRATVEWSYELLSEYEQRLFARLAVFAGGATLEAAEAVCPADLDTLQSLVEKSLVRRTDDRLWMLETIREYALERLEASGEAGELRRAHAEYCIDVVEHTAPRLRRGAQADAFARLEAELDNLRAALRLGAEVDPELLVRIVAGTGYFWLVRGYVDEARRWSELASHADAGTATARAHVLRVAGRGALTQGDPEQARRYFEEAVVRAREGNDGESLANALRGLGDIATQSGDNERARSYYEEARAASDEHGDDWSAAAILGSLANLALTESRWTEAYELSEQSVIRFRAVGDHAGAASGLANAALSALRLGRRPEAKVALGEAAVIGAADPEILGGVLETLAWLLVEAGNPVVSAESLGCAAAVLEQVGTSRGGAPEETIRGEAMLRLSRLMESADLEAAIRRGRDTSLEVALRRALAALG